MENPDEKMISAVKEWIKIDTEITKLKNEIKERTDKRKMATENLMSIMKERGVEGFNINGGAVLYKKSKVKKPLSGKTLLTALQNYYKDNAEVAEEIAKHVMDSREEQVKETIKRKIDKSS